MRREKIAGLDVVLAGGTDRAGGGRGPVMILLHGFGASGEDLVPLWRVIEAPEDTRFVFPAAPLQLDMGWGGDSRAWWMIDMEKLQLAMVSGRRMELAGEVPEGLPAARQHLLDLIAALPGALGEPVDRWAIGGFSQGAMLSLDVALRAPSAPQAVVLMSGTLLAEKEWTALMPARAGMPVFQSHGRTDPLLPFGAADKLRELLVKAGLPVDFVPFNGVHEIPGSVVDRLGKFLLRTLAASPAGAAGA
jgi:phospholipase/carboxylesterase